MLARSRTLGSADRAIGVIRTDQLGERVGDAHWRSARLSERGEACLPPWPSPIGPGTLSYSFQNFKPVSLHLSSSFSRNRNGALTKIQMNLRTIALALALLVPVSAQAATIIIDGDTIDIYGVRIRIVQIDAPETFGPRCENELILGLKAKKRLRELLDSGTVPRKHHGGFRDEARDCDRDVDGIAGPARGLAGSQPKPKPDIKRTTTCLEDLAHRHHPHQLQAVLTAGLVWG
jgi:hypothetical protein